MGRYGDRYADLEEDGADALDDVADADLYVPLRVKRAVRDQATHAALDQRLAQTGQKRDRAEDRAALVPTAGPKAKKSLLEMKAEADKVEGKQPKKDEAEERKEMEDTMMDNLLHSGKELRSVYDRAHGIQYTERMPSTWTPPRYVREMPAAARDRIRAQKNIVVEGGDVPAPILSFRDLRAPPALVDALRAKQIVAPTPIQQQGLPVVLMGRDMIGVAFTGSGKTLAFVLPMLLLSLDEERRLPVQQGEGPLTLAVAPSRELARQTHEVFCHYAGVLRQARQPELRCMLAIGGQSMREQDYALRRGMHAVVATPGRLLDNLEKKKITMDACRFVCLDEADRMVDMGFEEEVKRLYQYFRHQKQTVMFSATMPKKIQQFAMTALTDPITVNVNRAGAANLDVVQEVEHVKKERKVIYLLECLQKTSPPVLIFAQGKSDVDMVHEYLLLKCVDAVSIHGSKDQEERNEAVQRFRDKKADVLVATDICSKGLDFPDVQHVINYDLPKEIENYVHRIGRTGRCGKTGLATTFVNNDDDPTTLLDLKHLLTEARQRVPQFLQAMHDPMADMYAARGGARPEDGGGCKFCGGLGHTVSDCPKLRGQNRMALNQAAGMGFRGGGGGGGGEA